MRRLQGTEWCRLKDNLDLMYYETNSLGHMKGYYRSKATGDTFTHWLSDEEIIALDEPFLEIEPMDLLFVDISPDDCGGIVVPRIPETLDELYHIQSGVSSGDIILRGYVKHAHIMEGVKWL